MFDDPSGCMNPTRACKSAPVRRARRSNASTRRQKAVKLRPGSEYVPKSHGLSYVNGRLLNGRERAAIELVNAGIAPITAMRQALDTDGSLGATDVTSLLGDYVAHLSGWSPGWLDQCRGTALALYAHSTGVPQPTHIPSDALFHVPLV